MPVKNKFIVNGAWLGARETGWQLTGVDNVDFSGLSVAIATPSLSIALLTIPNVQPVAAQLGSSDSFYGSALGVANTHQAAGSLTVPQVGNIPWVGVFSNPILVSRTNANAVQTYGAAGNVSLMLVLVSGSNTSGTSISNNLMSAGLSLSALTNIQTAFALNSIPAARQLAAPGGGQVANSVLLFPGDTIIAQFTNSSAGAITVANGNTLALAFDMY